MDTQTSEIAEGIYRFSTFVPDIGPAGLTFNQYLIDDEQRNGRTVTLEADFVDWLVVRRGVVSGRRCRTGRRTCSGDRGRCDRVGAYGGRGGAG
jgi:hypothetical protein